LATTAFVTAATPTAATINALAYPVGSVYTSVVSTSPATLLGVGTWAAFGAGRVLIGLDAGDADFNSVEETGGSKTHTLTIAEMPSHTHTIPQTLIGAGGGSAKVNFQNNITQTTNATGGGQAHTIVQPYITVYFWKRTA
tara:strand:+ start:93 stop:512 length:420 start_codon:yes stop_codon:yes gene_type:complete